MKILIGLAITILCIFLLVDYGSLQMNNSRIRLNAFRPGAHGTPVLHQLHSADDMFSVMKHFHHVKHVEWCIAQSGSGYTLYKRGD